MARRDALTGDLFPDEPALRAVGTGYSPDIAGRGPLDARIARVVAHALREARDGRDDKKGMSRSEIAEALSEHLGRRVPETMIDKWASEASGDHRIPLDVFIALIAAAGCDELIGFVPSLFGHVAVKESHADLIRLMLIKEKRAELEVQERALEARLRRASR